MSQKTVTASTKGQTAAIVAMFFMFAMISFVTNLAAPVGTIWGNAYSGNAVLGMMGNMMNFLAYLFMGIPAATLLIRIGYKKTALLALIIGIIGLLVQYLSSVYGADIQIGSMVQLNYIIYLAGAFICGFCVCMLNTVVNPMLNMLGGGGNRGNQLVQAGGALNSLAGTLTPFLVGVLIGVLTKATTIAAVRPLLWIAMGVFVFAFLVISAVKIPEPHLQKKGDKKVKYTHSAWNFRHTVLGVIAIFFYVGTEVGIPGTLNFYLSDTTSRGADVLGAASLVAGVIVAIYWLLMLVGRLVSSVISGNVSSRAQILTVSTVAVLLVIGAILTPKSARIDVPEFIYSPVGQTSAILTECEVPQQTILAFVETGDTQLIEPYAEELALKYERTPEQMADALQYPTIPVSAMLLVLCGLCTSVMWGAIFNLAVEGLGKYTAMASGIFMMMVVGGGVMPLLQSWIADMAGYMVSYWLVVAMLCYILFYGLVGYKNVNTDIPVTEEEGNPLNL